MKMKWLARRTLLGTGTAFAGAGLFGADARSATANFVSALTQFQPTVSVLAQNAIAKLSSTTTLLSRLDLSPALLGVLTDILSAIFVGGGLKHNALVRRLRNPAMLKIASNPNFVPQGQGFSAAELHAYAPQSAHGSGL